MLPGKLTERSFDLLPLYNAQDRRRPTHLSLCSGVYRNPDGLTDELTLYEVDYTYRDEKCADDDVADVDGGRKQKARSQLSFLQNRRTTILAVLVVAASVSISEMMKLFLITSTTARQG